MEGRQLRWIVALTAVLVLLTGVLWFSEPPEVQYDPEETSEVVDDLELSEARSIRIVRNADDRTGPIELSKREGMWFVDAPFEAPAEPGHIVDILDAVRESRRGIPVEGPAERFGLAPPRAVLTVGMADGSERVLEVGDATPSDQRTYVFAKDRSVAAVFGLPAEPLMKRASEYRDHRIFDYDPSEVTRIMVRSGAGLLEATKNEHGWYLTGFSRADLDKLDTWIVQFTNLRVDLFTDLPEDVPSDPQMIIEVETPDGIQPMYLGRDTPYGPMVYFRGGLDGPMSPELLKAIPTVPTNIGVTDAFPALDDVERITLEGAREVTLVRDGDSWSGAPDAEAIPSALQLATLEYRPSPPASSQPELTVTLFEPGREPAVFEIGPVEQGYRAVLDTRGGGPVRVPADDLAALFGE